MSNSFADDVKQARAYLRTITLAEEDLVSDARFNPDRKVDDLKILSGLALKIRTVAKEQKKSPYQVIDELFENLPH